MQRRHRHLAATAAAAAGHCGRLIASGEKHLIAELIELTATASGGLLSACGVRWCVRTRKQMRSVRIGNHCVRLILEHPAARFVFGVFHHVGKLAFTHRYSFTDVTDGRIFQKRREHHHETGAQKNVDRFNVTDFWQLGICAGHKGGHGEHLEVDRKTN